MKINFHAQYLVLSLIGGAFVLPTAALAQGVSGDSPLDESRPWGNACTQAVTNRVQRENPNNNGIYMSGGLRQFQASNAEVGVYGEGEFLIGSNQRNVFGFNCIYNIRSGKVSSVAYDVHHVINEGNRTRRRSDGE